MEIGTEVSGCLTAAHGRGIDLDRARQASLDDIPAVQVVLAVLDEERTDSSNCRSLSLPGAGHKLCSGFGLCERIARSVARGLDVRNRLSLLATGQGSNQEGGCIVKALLNAKAQRLYIRAFR